MYGRKPNRFFIIVIIFVILAVIFGAIQFVRGKDGKNQKSEVLDTAPTPTEYQFPTDTPTPEASPTPEESATPTPKPTLSPLDKETGLDRSTLSIEVQNGSGEVGAASKASDTLKTFGYHIIAIGNADNFNYENVIIKVKGDKNTYLPLLKKDLGFSYTIGTSSADLSASASADSVVIVGK